MGIGKIVGLGGNFDITYSNTPDYTYISTTGNTITLSKSDFNTDFWNRAVTMGKIKFVLYGGRGVNGSSTNYGTGGAGGKGSVATVTSIVANEWDTAVFVLEFGGLNNNKNKGGAGGVGPRPTGAVSSEYEKKGESGIDGGGGGGCSGESYANLKYDETSRQYFLNPYKGGNGGRGGDGCSVYMRICYKIPFDGKLYQSYNLLETACGGGGGGGASGLPYISDSVDGEGGLAGRPATIVNGVVQPGAGGSNTRDDQKTDGQNATSPAGYTSTYANPRIEVYAPQW